MRLPNVVVVTAGHYPQTLIGPPAIVIEVLAPDESYTEVERSAQEYCRIGIPNIWLIEPETRTSRVCRKDAWVETTRFTIANSPIYLDVPDLFARLDRHTSPASQR